MKRFAFTLGAFAIALTCFWFGARTQQSERRDHFQSESEAADSHARDDLPSELDLSATHAQRFDVQPLADALNRTASATSSSAPDFAPALVRLRGSIVVLDENGVEQTSEDGTLDIELRGGEQTHSVEALVKKGQWLLDVQPCRELRIERVMMRGRIAVADGAFTWTAVPVDGVLDLRLQWLRATLLHVRDARTRLELDQVKIEVGFGQSELRSQDCPSPFGWVFVQISGDSPLTIPPEACVNSHLAGNEEGLSARVCAPNHAWNLVPIDASRGGEVFVDLMPAAGLDVDVIGDEAARSARLRIRAADEDETVLDEALAGRTRVSIDHLSPGLFRVSLEFGPAWEGAVAIATAEVELFPETRANMVLRPPPSPSVVRANMSGTLLIPREWRAEPSDMEARLVGTNASDDDQYRWIQLTPLEPTSTYDRFAWESKRAVVGHWDLSLRWSELPFEASVELGADGLADICLEVASPTSVRMRFVDGENGDPIRPDFVLWRTRQFSQAWYYAGASAHFEPRVDAFEFRAPLGPIHILASALRQGYTRSEETAVLAPGANEFQWKLLRANGVVIRLLDGTRVVKARGLASFQLEPIEGAGKMVDTYFGELETYLAVSVPGRYRLNLEHPLQGYLFPPEQVVDITRNTMTPVEIQLTRNP